MLSKRNVSICGIGVCLFFFFASATVHAADTTEQIIKQVDEILNANPLRAAEKVQRIKVAEDSTITVLVLRLVEGAEVKAHFHKTHDETDYCIKGTGRMLVNDKWVYMKPGTLHFNPIGKVHHTKNTGNGPMMVIAIYTPAMKEPDSNFVQ
jgi:quercetin dioxygenase-like cupin family protein